MNFCTLNQALATKTSYLQKPVNPTSSSISRLFNMAMSKNVLFIKHYKKLDQQFTTPTECYSFYLNEHKASCINKITLAGTRDPDSPLGTYSKVNPALISPKFYTEHLCNERDRKLLTKYRTGSHNLCIQTGRHYREKRHERLCTCKKDIQTIDHVLFQCEQTVELRTFHMMQNSDVQNFFESEDYILTSSILKTMKCLLNIKEY